MNALSPIRLLIEKYESVLWKIEHKSPDKKENRTMKMTKVCYNTLEDQLDDSKLKVKLR